jgi:hypothetical protein
VNDSVQAVQNPEQPNQGPASGVGGQPGGQVGQTLKVEQGHQAQAIKRTCKAWTR